MSITNKTAAARLRAIAAGIDGTTTAASLLAIAAEMDPQQQEHDPEDDGCRYLVTVHTGPTFQGYYFGLAGDNRGPNTDRRKTHVPTYRLEAATADCAKLSVIFPDWTFGVEDEETGAKVPLPPAFRAGAPVRVKVPDGHEPSAFNGERGTLVCKDGERWQVILPQHGLTRSFYPDELTVLE